MPPAAAPISELAGDASSTGPTIETTENLNPTPKDKANKVSARAAAAPPESFSS
jgi:hypothetical protein